MGIKQFTHWVSVILLGTFTVFEQYITDKGAKAQQNQTKFGEMGLKGPVGVFDRPKGVKGTPYLFEEWYKGEITYLNDRTLSVEKIRYDIYKGELLVFRNKNEMAILPKNLINSFTIFHPQSPEPLRYVKAGHIADLNHVGAEQFVLVLYQGTKASLYARQWKTFEKAYYRDPYSPAQHNDEFSEPNLEFYLVKSEEVTHEIKLRRGAILNALEEQKSALKNFIKEKQLFFDDTNDLVEVIKYYDQIALKE